VLAAALLAACSGAGSSSAIPGGNSVVPMGQSHGGYRVVTEMQQNTSCPSSYVACYTLTPGSPFSDEWCISNTGNCTSGLYNGTVKWTIATKPYKVSTGKRARRIKAGFNPKIGNPSDNIVTAKAKVKSTNGAVGYALGWEACLESGSYKGTCFGPELVGLIVN
jgi:hypothetical protein